MEQRRGREAAAMRTGQVKKDKREGTAEVRKVAAFRNQEGNRRSRGINE